MMMSFEIAECFTETMNKCTVIKEKKMTNEITSQ